MSNKQNQHPWEEEAWQQMEGLLDQELPVRPVGYYLRRLSAAVFLFILGSAAIMFLMPDSEQEELATKAINERGEIGYAIATVDVDPDQRIERSSTWGDLTDATDLDGSWASSLPSFSTRENFDFQRNRSLRVGSDLFDHSGRQMPVSSIDFLDGEFLFSESIELHNVTLSDSDIIKSGSRLASIVQFAEVNSSYMTQGHWGGGIHYGIELGVSSRWRASISAGYQYHRFAGIHGQNNYSVPLILPEPGSEPFEPNTSSENNSIKLPELHPNLHQLSMTGQLYFTPWKERGIEMGAIVRGQKNMYFINSEIVNSPMRFSYQDLNTTKQQDDWSHYSLSLGAGLSYAFSPRWKIHSRAFYTNNFIGSQAKPGFIDDHLWSAEWGVSMYW